MTSSRRDLCINNSPATIIVAWGSVYGMNDVTHLGLYDIPMMSGIPNLVYLAPTSREEYLAMLDWSIDQTDHPVAIRMPGGPLISTGEAVKPDFSRLNEYQVTHRGAKVALLGLGSFFSLAQQAAALLKTQTGIDATVINPRFITGLDEKLLRELTADHDVVVTLEDGQLDGGFGEKIARILRQRRRQGAEFRSEKGISRPLRPRAGAPRQPPDPGAHRFRHQKPVKTGIKNPCTGRKAMVQGFFYAVISARA